MRYVKESKGVIERSIPVSFPCDPLNDKLISTEPEKGKGAKRMNECRESEEKRESCSCQSPVAEHVCCCSDGYREAAFLFFLLHDMRLRFCHVGTFYATATYVSLQRFFFIRISLQRFIAERLLLHINKIPYILLH